MIGTEGEFTAIDCPGDCEDSNEGDFTIDLRAIPDPGWHFEGWSGACSGRDPECTLFVDRQPEGHRDVRTGSGTADPSVGADE